MAKAFFTVRGNPRAVTAIRRQNDGSAQPLSRAIPDGDTVGVEVLGSGAVRFLGIDTAEKSFEQPLGGTRGLDGQPWEDFLTDPFAAGLPPAGLDAELVDHLQARVGQSAAKNHHRHAVAAGNILRQLVQDDITTLGQQPDDFGFFLSFSYEVFDTFGRFLSFINRNQPDPNNPGPRPDSYNLRMLKLGAALPYIIWPNVNPFRQHESIADAVLLPGTAKAVGETSDLKRARDRVKAARAAGTGVFDSSDPLEFEAFEIRYLGRRRGPSRAVIDLSREEDTMYRPQSYFKIPNPEDRLFIPSEFVPLFASKGWRLEGF